MVVKPTPPAFASLQRATLPLQGRDKKKPTLRRPYSLRRRVRRNPSRLSPGTFFAPRQKPRGWSAERRILSQSTPCEACAPFAQGARLSALHRGDFSPRVRASRIRSGSVSAWRCPFWAAAPCSHGTGCPGSFIASSSQSGRSAARSGPEASRVRGYEPRPQAPHLAPSSERLAKTPSAEPGALNIIALERAGISFCLNFCGLCR